MSTSKEKVTYSEYSKTSLDIWRHYLRACDGQTVKCKLCAKVLKSTGGSTSGMRVHLRACHPYLTTYTENLDEGSSSSPASTSTGALAPSTDASSPAPSTSTCTDTPPTKKKKLMTDYFKSSDSMEAMVSRMAAIDGISFRLFIESRDLRQLFKNSGHVLPKSATTISVIVFKYAEDVTQDVKKTITQMKTEGHRFSTSLDEWTSLRSKRYMNINLHCRQFGGFLFKNLGLVRISGRMPATTLISVLRDHLDKFGISLEEDIVSLATDGASVMKKMGTYFEGHHQLCLAHGVQLAVIDTIYKVASVATEPEIQDMEFSDSTETETDDDDDDLTMNEEGQFEIEIPRVRADPVLYKEAIDKVRKVVKNIRKSPLKADALRAYVVHEFNHNIELQLDCRTRWSSMAAMIGSFLKIKISVFKVLIDHNSHIHFSEEEVQCLTELYESLEIVKITVLSICRRDATLYTADTALKFMLNKLDLKNTFVSNQLAVNMRKRIKERRLLVAGVLHYLHDVENFYATPDDDTFRKPTSEDICETIVSLLQRLKYGAALSASVTDFEEPSVSIEGNAGTSSTGHGQLSLQEELDTELKKCKSITKTLVGTSDFDLRGFVMTEKAMYDNNGERGVYLTEAYQYLSSLLPTSVESERIFSSAGFFCTKIRSSLSDRMLNSLFFFKDILSGKTVLRE